MTENLSSKIKDVIQDDETFEIELTQRLDALAGLYRAAHLDEETIAQKIEDARKSALQDRSLYIRPTASAQELGVSGSVNDIQEKAAAKVANFFDVTEEARELQAHVASAAPILVREPTPPSGPEMIPFFGSAFTKIFTEELARNS